MEYNHEKNERTRRGSIKGREATMPPEAPTLWSAMDGYLTARGLDPRVASFNKWYPSDQAGDRLARIVMPASNPEMRIYWQARAMALEGVAKRYNSPAVPRGSNVILCWPRDSEQRDTTVFITEGPMDALAFATHGYVGVATMGNQVREESMRYLFELFPDRVLIVVPDSDALDAGANLQAYIASQGRFSLMAFTKPHKDFSGMPKDKREIWLLQVNASIKRSL